MSLRCNRGKPLETLGRKARNLTGRPHDSSAARNYLLCGFLYFEGNGRSAFGIYFDGSKKRKKGTQPNGAYWTQTTFSFHWVVITELKTDEIAGTSTVKVSTWGGYAYLDLDSFINGEKVYECVLYFE